jgi:hypothetical protein
LSISFKTFTIPDSLYIYDSGNNEIFSLIDISTGNNFETAYLSGVNDCNLSVCVDAPLDGTAWVLEISGCLNVSASGGQLVIPRCWTEPSAEYYCIEEV